EKLADCPAPKGLGLRIPVQGWLAVYAATVSPYGAVPATLLRQGGSASELFLLLTEEDNVACLTRTETRGGNYDLYEMTADAARLARLPTDIPVLAYVARAGALRIDGHLRPL